MKRENRVKKNWEFQNIIKLKNQIVTTNLILYFKKNEAFQVGISIPKKFAIAVKRNYYRRQIKAILNKLDIKEMHFQTIIIIRKPFINLTYQQKEKEVLKIYERMKNGQGKQKTT